MIKLRFTAERITEESAAEGMAAESGWVEAGNKHQIYEEQTPAEEFETREEVMARIEEVIGSYEGEDGENFYGVDLDNDYVSGDSYRYAAHIEE